MCIYIYSHTPYLVLRSSGKNLDNGMVLSIWLQNGRAIAKAKQSTHPHCLEARMDGSMLKPQNKWQTQGRPQFHINMRILYQTRCEGRSRHPFSWSLLLRVLFKSPALRAAPISNYLAVKGPLPL